MTMEFESAGSLAVAGLVAHEIEASEKGHTGAAHHDGRCLNCDTPLGGEFCHQCGQRAHVHKSLLHLGEEVLHGILHFDAKGLRTVPMLVLHPGQLTRRYIDGHRTRYVSPLALFLFMVFLMFFVASLTSGKSATNFAADAVKMAAVRQELAEERREALKEIAKAEAALAKAGTDPAAVSSANIALGAAHADLAELDNSVKVLNTTGRLVKNDRMKMSGFTTDTGWPAADEAIRHAAANPELTIYKLKSSGSKLSFLLVPISLPFLWLLFCWRRGVTMYDHAVFALYSLSFMSLMFVLVFVLKFAGLGMVLPWLICLAPPVHMFAQLRGTYALTRGEALWRTAALLCISGMVFVLYLVLILIMSMR